MSRESKKTLGFWTRTNGYRPSIDDSASSRPLLGLDPDERHDSQRADEQTTWRPTSRNKMADDIDKIEAYRAETHETHETIASDQPLSNDRTWRNEAVAAGGVGDGDADEEAAAAAAAGRPAYRTYRRRWFGLAQLALLNIVVSWDWLTYSPVVVTSAQFFGTSQSTVNWLATAFLFGFAAAAPFSIYALHHHGPKASMAAASVLILAGNWIRYGGTRATPAPSYAAVMVGQILCGLAQPFILAAPTTYSELWFTPRGRISATAITSLANPLGGAIGELVNPSFVTDPSSIPSMTLYVAIISSVAAIPTFFLPARPPTPVAPSTSTSAVTSSKSMVGELRALARCRDFWLIFVLFSVYVGFFNSLSSLLVQMMTPYGFSEDGASIAGAILILVGLLSAAVTSPLVDRYKRYQPVIRTLVPVLGACYLAFIWAPPAGTLTAAYVICALLGAASFSLVPIVLEALAEVTYPVGPAFSSVVCWTGGQILGAVFIIISDALEDDAGAYGPPGNLQRALWFQAAVAVVAVPFAVALGWRRGLATPRLDADRAPRS